MRFSNMEIATLLLAENITAHYSLRSISNNKKLQLGLRFVIFSSSCVAAYSKSLLETHMIFISLTSALFTNSLFGATNKLQ